MFVKRAIIYCGIGLLIVVCYPRFSFGRGADSVLVIRQAEETFPLNPYTGIYKDQHNLDFQDVERKTAFVPLGIDHYQLREDETVSVYWGRAFIQNLTGQALRYVLYFHPGLDTVEIWVRNSSGASQNFVLSSLQSTRQRPLRVVQEMCAPITLEPGLSTIFFKIPNHSLWARQQGAIIVNLAEERTFINL